MRGAIIEFNVLESKDKTKMCDKIANWFFAKIIKPNVYNVNLKSGQPQKVNNGKEDV